MTRVHAFAAAIILAGVLWRLATAHVIPDSEIALLATTQLRDDGRSIAALQTIQQASHWREMILPFGGALLLSGLIGLGLSRVLLLHTVRHHED